jgi:hypothetical protein
MPNRWQGSRLPAAPGKETGPMETGISLPSGDIGATHASYKALGIDIDEEVMRMGDPVPPMFWFRDPGGHSLTVVEEA